MVHNNWIDKKWYYEENTSTVHISPDLENEVRDLINRVNIKSLDADIIMESLNYHTNRKLHLKEK